MCDYRVCRCGVNSSACKRQLRSWFKGDVANGQGKLVRCDKHGETVSRAEGRGGGERERERRKEQGEGRKEKGEGKEEKRREEERRGGPTLHRAMSCCVSAVCDVVMLCACGARLRKRFVLIRL